MNPALLVLTPSSIDNCLTATIKVPFAPLILPKNDGVSIQEHRIHFATRLTDPWSRSVGYQLPADGCQLFSLLFTTARLATSPSRWSHKT